ncbi:MAG: DNA-directed RNA polymerase subunit omega [Pseudomonadota bacterium]|nr:DNA-directed RNA polymerase subunit omega [Pseudomonadota bacterium]
MARVTVEDCIKIIDNRFELILVASERSKTLAKGVEPLLERDRDKNPVLALREIAENKLDLNATKEDLVKGLQSVHEEVLVEPEDSNTNQDDQPVDDDLIKDLEANAGEAGLSIEENE